MRYKDIEELLAWFDDRCEAGVRVTGKSLKTEALRLHKLKGNQNFQASQGWYSSFIKRNKISMRRSTHIAQHSREITDNSFRENVIVTCKSVVFFFFFFFFFFLFGNQISKWHSFEKKKAIFDLIFTFFSHQGKDTKIPSGHITLTYIHMFCSPY